MEKQQKMSYRDELQAMMRAKEEQKRAEKERLRQEDMLLVRPEEFVQPRGARGGVYQPLSHQQAPQNAPQMQPQSYASPPPQYGGYGGMGGVGGGYQEEPNPQQWQDNNGDINNGRQAMPNEQGSAPVDQRVSPLHHPLLSTPVSSTKRALNLYFNPQMRRQLDMQSELKRQIAEKAAAKEREKERERQEDIKEEERLRAEADKLKAQFDRERRKENGEADEPPKDPVQASSQNQLTLSLDPEIIILIIVMVPCRQTGRWWRSRERRPRRPRRRG